MFLPTDPPHLRERMVALPTGASLHVVEREGSEPPVVLLHGVWSWWRHWLPLLTAADDPFQGQRLLLPEFRGHGESSRSGVGYSLDGAAADIIALIQQERVTRFVLGGHSLGGLICLMIAAPLSERIEAMILEEPPLPLPTNDIAADAAERWLDFASGAAELAELRHQPADLVVEALLERDPELTRREAEAVALCLSMVDERVFEAVLTDAATQSSNVILPHLAMPVLALQGGDAARRMLQEIGVAQLRALAPKLTLVTIPDAGHSLLSVAHEEYCVAIRRFLGQRSEAGYATMSG